MLKYKQEILWSSAGKSRCLLMDPAHRYELGSNGTRGCWVNTLEKYPEVEEERELFYLASRDKKDKAAWRYMGTYRCVGEGLYTWETVKELANKVSDFVCCS